MLVPPELLMAQLMAVIRAHMAAEPDAFKVSADGVCSMHQQCAAFTLLMTRVIHEHMAAEPDAFKVSAGVHWLVELLTANCGVL
jgi:hypothetical protein